MIRAKKRRMVAAALLGVVTMLSTACSAGSFDGIYDLPLPGGPDIGDKPYHVVARFTDALNLVPHSAVKVDNVPVGTVQDIRLQGNGWQDGWTAEVTLAINADVVLPENAVARIKQTSLLGEKYVELIAPADLASGGKGTAPVTVPKGQRLGDDAVIPVNRTNTGVEVEQLLGALSLLLNGGGVAQLHTITAELSNVMDGNEQEIKAFLSNMNELVSSLDANRHAITRTLDELNRLAKRLADREDQINTALTELSPGLRSLSEQTDQLVGMLQALDDLGTVAVDVIRRSKENIVADLEALAPILQRLVQAGSDLPKALEILPTFPFTDAVLDAIKGDYMNAFVTVDPTDDYTPPIPPLTPPEQTEPGSGGSGGSTGGTP